MAEPARTRYARTADGASVAYQVVGDGPLDLVFVPGLVSHVEAFWRDPSIAYFYDRLASFSRLVLFDKRGTGLSDPVHGPQPLEERILDVRAVMDAAGSERAALVGLSEGSAMSAVFAASSPERVSSLVMCGTIVGGPPERHPAGARWQTASAQLLAALDQWGDGITLPLVAPDMGLTTEQAGEIERISASPSMARAIVEMWFQIDLRDVLPAITVPTLVLHREREIFPVEAAQDVASRIPDARLVVMPGDAHAPWTGDTDRYVAEIQEFLTGVREQAVADRVLATVLVTDVVASTERAATLGDVAWRKLIARHDELVRAQLRRFGGKEVKHTGDGFLATFDGPARAIRCASEVVRLAPEQLGVEVRAGVHSGEVELVGDDVRGLAVHIAARVSGHAGAGEVLVSSTVKELVLGSGVGLEPAGTHSLKGVPGEWSLFRAI